ncbi:DUF6233 domain-containing protein [Streptomyces silvensis]|uniref:Uncharacterized protein n=1 Tax=Streptomyces silvensis TaxID=1765722 RepID=A0A0W7X397_9ACTN|nr:DUF6233 domain-containing protein [Streptomyces silvensis]KUF17385.1 hypothetical protein AT728_16420 [Streptomyces silvensis]
MAEPLPPPVRVLLPDGQAMTGYLRAQHQTPSGWLLLVGLPSWRNVGTQGEGVEPGEYRVLLTTGQVSPIEGVDYSGVEVHRLPAAPSAAPSPRWAWSVQRLRRPDGRPAGTVVHEYGCEDSPGGAHELNLDQALAALEREGARACKECAAAEVLGRFLPSS